MVDELENTNSWRWEEVRFELENGHWTEVVVVKIRDTVILFPKWNEKLVRSKGTPEAKMKLKEILGEES